MILRRANIGDLEVIQNLFVETIKSTCTSDYSQEQIDVWTSSIENSKKWIHKIKTQYFIVAQIEDEIVGFGALKNQNYVDLLYVHKDHLRKGIAKQILNKLKNKAHERGHQSVSSDVSITARPFFEKNGFNVVKENEFELKGVLISNFLMKSE